MTHSRDFAAAVARAGSADGGLARAPLRRRGHPRGRSLGDRGAGGPRGRADGCGRHRSGRCRRRAGAPGPDPHSLRQGQQRRRRPGGGRAAAGERLRGRRGRALRRRAPCRPRRLARGLRRGRRRDLRNRLRRRAARAGCRRDRSGEPVRRPRRRLRHRLRRRRLQRRGRPGGDRGRGHRQLSRGQARPPGGAREVVHGRAAGGVDRHSRGGARSSRPAGRSSPRSSAWRPAAARTRPSSAPGRSRSPAARVA